MPLYDYHCATCGLTEEYLTTATTEKYRRCPGSPMKEFAGLRKKCSGIMKKLPGIFSIHDPWRWAVITGDGMGILQDPGDPVGFLYESEDEQEFYEGPNGEFAYDEPSIMPQRRYDGIPWWHREEWEIAQAEQEATEIHEEE